MDLRRDTNLGYIEKNENGNLFAVSTAK